MRYYINLGSNLGNRNLNLSRAVRAIEREFGWFELSHYVESEPFGFESVNKFLNVGMLFISEFQPLDVLHLLQKIEKEIGEAAGDSRHRNADGSYRDRYIDIDIMAVDNIHLSTPELTLPHPGLKDRAFFLEPFRELLSVPIPD